MQIHQSSKKTVFMLLEWVSQRNRPNLSYAQSNWYAVDLLSNSSTEYM